MRSGHRPGRCAGPGGAAPWGAAGWSVRSRRR
ncbi:hypothetical protein LGR64_16785 [Delftia sp. Lp-1]|nr:hypothetical protein [Delftia sp. Lp-1]